MDRAQGLPGDLQRPGCRVDRLVSQEELARADIAAGFEPMGGKAMAECLETFAVLAVGRPLGVGGDLLSGPNGQRLIRVHARKPPPWRAIHVPIGSQCSPQAGREEWGAVLAPFAWLDAQEQARPLAVGARSMPHRTDTPASGVRSR